MADPRKVPIDIQYKKLLEGLVDRRIVEAKWAEQHQQLRDGLAVLYPELPRATEKLIKFQEKKPMHDELTYFDCKYVLACLQDSPEGVSKNFFGQYTSPVIKKWQALVRMYEKNNVFAAEAARVVAQNTAFEIPFLKKTRQQNEKQAADNKRKIMDLTKSIAEYRRKLETACSEIGIRGEHFREELQRLPLELPGLYADVAATICSPEIVAATEYHAALQSYLQSAEAPAVEVNALATSETGTTESKKDKRKKSKAAKAKAPVVEEETDAVVAAGFDAEMGPHVFFSALSELRNASDAVVAPMNALDSDEMASAVDIDWGISMEDSGAATIDWGIETLPTDASTEVTATSDDAVDMETPVEIDWDITTIDDLVKEDITYPAVVVAVAEGGDLITTEDTSCDEATAPTRVELLGDSDFRGRVLNDLLEMKMFLCQRRDELADATNVAFATQFHGSSPLLEHQTKEKIEAFKQAVARAIEQLTSKRLQQLMLIQSSDRYLDRHVASLQILTKHMDKCERDIRTLEDKNTELVDAAVRIQPQIEALVSDTKTLKKELEASLPALFKGYKVNIVGDVNNL